MGNVQGTYGLPIQCKKRSHHKVRQRQECWGYIIPIFGDIQSLIKEDIKQSLKLDGIWSWPRFGGSNEQQPDDLHGALSAWIIYWFCDEQKRHFIACLVSTLSSQFFFITIVETFHSELGSEPCRNTTKQHSFITHQTDSRSTHWPLISHTSVVWPEFQCCCRDLTGYFLDPGSTPINSKILHIFSCFSLSRFVLIVSKQNHEEADCAFLINLETEKKNEEKWKCIEKLWEIPALWYSWFFIILF